MFQFEGENEEQLKVPREERSRVDFSGDINVELLEDALNGLSDLALEDKYCMSISTIRLKVNMGLRFLEILSGKQYEKKAFDNFLEYKSFWQTLIERYKVSIRINTTDRVSLFCELFDGLSHREKMLVKSFVDKTINK